MTKEELEKENAELRAIAENQQSSNMERYFKNKELEKENAELKKDRDYFSDALDKQVEATLELQKKYQELEKQIEKMKCCGNCKYFR